MKRKILVAASVFHALNDSATVTIPMIFPLLYTQKYLVTKYSHIGLLSYLGLFVTFLSQFIIVNKAYRFEYRHILLFSLLGISFTVITVTLASSFWFLLIFYLLMRFFASFYHPIGVSWVSVTHEGKKLDSAMGIQSGSGNLGVFIAFIFAGFLAQNISWKAPLFFYTVMCLIIGTAAFLLVKDIKSKIDSPPDVNMSLWKDTLIQIKKFIPGFLFGGACWGITVFFVPSLLNHKFGISLSTTGIILAGWIGTGTVITYLYGYFSKKFGRWRVCLGGFTGATICLYVLGVAKTSHLAVVSLFFFGTFLFLTYPAFKSFVGELVPARNQAVAFSLVANIQMLAASLAGLFSGFLADRFGISASFIFLAVFGTIVSGIYLFKRR